MTSPTKFYHMIVDVVTWPKFGNCSISMRGVVITSWFKFNNLGLTLGMNLKFYTSVAKGLKLKVRKIWGLIPTFVEVTKGKLVEGVEGGGWHSPPLPPSWTGLIISCYKQLNDSLTKWLSSFTLVIHLLFSYSLHFM